jgi:hypothetical protein
MLQASCALDFVQHPSQQAAVINPFLFIKNKLLFKSSKGFLHPWKTQPDMLSEDSAAYPLGWQPSAYGNGSLAPFMFEFKLCGLGVSTLFWT